MTSLAFELQKETCNHGEESCQVCEGLMTTVPLFNTTGVSVWSQTNKLLFREGIVLRFVG